MNPDIQKEILATLRDNNKILHAMNRERRITNFVWIIKWIIFIGLAYGAYQSAMPYFLQANTALQQVNNFNNSVKGINPQSIQQGVQNALMQKFKGAVGQ
jgi:hypothetical protein